MNPSAQCTVAAMATYTYWIPAAFAVFCGVLALLPIASGAVNVGVCAANTFAFDPRIVNAVVTNAIFHEANTTVQITNLFSSINVDDLPAFCQVQVLITTNATAKSTAHTEVWLPISEDWNGRYVAFGNGGFGGGGWSNNLFSNCKVTHFGFLLLQ